MAKVLITGSNSFVGNNFRKYSKCRDVEEISLLDNKPEEINFDKYDVVLHVAAIVHQSDKISDDEYFRVNRDLCLRVAEASKKAGVKQFVFLSTLKVYGEFVKPNELRNENSECFPDDAYGKSKYAAETGLKKIEDSDFTVSIVRTPLVYGEGVKANMLNLVKLVETLPVLPFDKIANRRNFSFAENLVGFIDRIIEMEASGVFIAMDELSVSTTSLIKYISNSLGKKTYLFKLPDICFKIGRVFVPRAIDRLCGSAEFDNSRTKEILNFTPHFSTEEGINKMVKYYLVSKNKS
jgi:UDP-glucose 4-epimerase